MWEYDESIYFDQHCRWSKEKVVENLGTCVKIIHENTSYLFKRSKYWKLQCDGEIVQGVTSVGWKELFKRKLLPDCLYDCKNRITVGTW